jgi:thiamine kinase-like enzyme
MNTGDRINAILAALGWERADCEIDETTYGATNLSYFCTYKGNKNERNEKYIIRIGAENSDLLVINRRAEKAAMEAVRGADYYIPLIYFNDSNGDMVTKYADADAMTFEEFSQDENIIKMAAIMKDLHSRKTDYFFNPYDDVEKKLNYIKQYNIPLHEKFNEAYGIYASKRDANPIFEKQYLGLCHNDITLGNCLISKDKKRIYLIDYEFSGMGNIYTDLLCCVNGLTDEKQQIFFREYFGGYKEYMTEKTKDFLVIVLMWNVTWAYLKSLAPGASNVDYMNHGNQWIDAILNIK